MSDGEVAPSDEEVVERALDGDHTAVSTLIDRHADAVYGECRASAANLSDALDAMHAVFVRAGARLSKLTDPSRLEEWLIAIARRQMVGLRRGGRWTLISAKPPQQPEQPDAAVVTAQFRQRLSVEMMVALGFGPAAPTSPPGEQDPPGPLRFAELWPTAPYEGDEWDWAPDGFPLTPSGLAVRTVFAGCIVAALILALAGFLILPLLRSSPDVQVGGIVESTDGTPRALGGDTTPSDEQDPSRMVGVPPPNDSSTGVIGSSTSTALTSEDVSDGSSTSAANPGSAANEVAAPALQPTPSVQPSVTVGPGEPAISSSLTSTTIAATEPGPTTAAASRGTTTPSTSSAIPTTTMPSTSTIRTTTTSTGPTTTSTPTTTTNGSTSVSTSTTSTSTTTTTSTSTTTTSTSTTTTTSTSTTTTTVVPNSAPTVSNAILRPGSVRVSHGSCVPGTATISARASDTDGSIIDVVAQWSANGEDQIFTPLVDQGNGQYEATLGPWSIIGEQTVVVVAADDDGAQAQDSDAINVRSCPGKTE